MALTSNASTTKHQARLAKILGHLLPVPNETDIDHTSNALQVNPSKNEQKDEKKDEKKDKKRNASSTTKSLTESVASTISDKLHEIDTDKVNDIHKAVREANQSLTKVSHHVQPHGHNAEIHTATTYNIDAIEKGISARAFVNSDYHGAADINIIDNGKIVHQIQSKCTTSASYAKQAAKNSKYNGMTKVVNKEMANKHPSLQSTVEYNGAQSKPFSHEEMINKKNFNKLKISKESQQARKNEIMAQNARIAAGIGAGIGATISIMTDISDGDKDAEEVIRSAAKEAGKGAIVGVANSVLTSFVGGNPATMIMTGCDVVVNDIAGYLGGEISGKECAKNTAIKTASAGAGMMGGAWVGGFLGSCLGPPGAIVGSLLGGMVSSWGASKGVTAITSKL